VEREYLVIVLRVVVIVSTLNPILTVPFFTTIGDLGQAT
jgi:hypothetical protein